MMDSDQMETPRTASPATGQGRRQAATLLPLVGAGVLWLLLSNRFPLVETRGSDVVLLVLLALAASALWTLRATREGLLKSHASSFLWTATLLGLSFAGLIPALNGAFDRHAPYVFTTIVNSKRCRKASCTWELRGAPRLPLEAPMMTLQAFRTLDASLGDTLILGIKPGLFRRAWIASRAVHKVERSRLACARLTAPAVRGDTAQLGMLLAEGLSIEDEEPALNCEPPLLAASEAGEVSAVEFLLRRGADPNHAASDGRTPLMGAVNARKLSVVRSLLDHGADPRAVIHRGSGWTRDVTGIALDVGDTAIIRVIANAIPHSGSPPSGH
jgi:hypothetical protein